jgi:predicted transcriptional regulator
MQLLNPDIQSEIEKIQQQDEHWDPMRHKRIYELQNSDFHYEDAIPETGFIRDYFNLQTKVTSSPDVFHLMGALISLASILGNNVCIDPGGRKIFPNLWCLILAPSTLYRKSTAITCAEEIIRLYDPKVIYPNEFSRESMVQVLSKRPAGLYGWKEFTNILKYFNQTYMQGTKEMFMELFDSPSQYERHLKYDSCIIKYPAISIFAASPLSLLEESLKQSDLLGGFYSRFIYVPVTELSKQTIPIPPPPDKKVLGKIQSYIDECLKPICQANKQGPHGEFRPVTFKTDLIIDEYAKWMLAHEDSIRGHPQESLLASFYVRLSNYCLKCAMLYQISLMVAYEDFNEQIQLESLTYGINLTNYLTHKLTVLFTEELNVPDNWYARQRRWIVKAVTENGGKMNKRNLQQNSNLIADQFNKVISSMVGEGSIRHFNEGKKHYIELIKEEQTSKR